MTAVPVLAGIGFLLSLYALRVQAGLKRNPEHRAACDISENISCSKAFSSSFSHTLGIPNPLTGAVYYLLLVVLSLAETGPVILLILSVPALCFSIYLAYVSYVKQRNFCLVCSATYVLNVCITILSAVAV